MGEDRLLSETSYDSRYHFLDGAKDPNVCAVCGNPIAWWEHRPGVIIGWMHYTEARRFRYCGDDSAGPEAEPEDFQVIM